MFKYKQVILIRTDLKMGKGKLCGQAAHASVYSLGLSPGEIVHKWFNEGMRKIILKVNSEEEIVKYKSIFDSYGLKSVIVKDRGLTQIESGTITALGIEICENEKIDPIIKDLKLL